MIGIDIREGKSQIETALAEKTYFIAPTPRELTPAGRNFFSLSGGSSSGEYRQHLMRKEVDHGDHVLAIPAYWFCTKIMFSLDQIQASAFSIMSKPTVGCPTVL
jgi:hypothetical protein